MQALLSRSHIMRNWNITGQIKALILFILSGLNLLNPVPPDWQGFNVLIIFVPLVLPLVVIPIMIKLLSNFGAEIKQPSWNDNPLKFKRPLNFFHFASFFMICSGLALILGTVVRYQGFMSVGLVALSYGIGILGGIHLTVKFFGSQKPT